MKLSIAWIFEHIQADWKKVDIPNLVDTFNRTTAEIEHFYKVSLNLDLFTLVRVVSVRPDTVIVESPEFKKEFSLSYRDDAVDGKLFLVKKQDKTFQWASVRDWYCNKDGLLPALYCDEHLCAGGWKKNFEQNFSLLIHTVHGNVVSTKIQMDYYVNIIQRKQILAI